VVQTVAVGAWAYRAWKLWSEPATLCRGSCEETWFKWTQATLAVAGIILAFVLVAYLLRIAFVDRTWQRRRTLTIVFGAVAASWSGLVIAVIKEWP
jgi:hypothetical protein